MKNKIKLTITPPRCKACRERSKIGGIDDILKLIRISIEKRWGTNIPIQITIKKLSGKQK